MLVMGGALRNISEPLALLPYKSISVNDFFLTGGRWEYGSTTAERPEGEPRLAVEDSNTRRNLWIQL